MIWLQRNYFTLMLLAAVALGFLLPEGGMRGGWLRSEITTLLGVMLLFLIQGLSLPTRALAAGMLSWRLHAFVQLWNFLFTPAIIWGMTLVLDSLLNPAAWDGFWYLAILPTTVSSAVILTTLSRGDTAGAVFNTTLANVLAVFIVPLWTVALFSLSGSVETVDLEALLWNLAQLILLPLLLGQLLRPWVAPMVLFQRASRWFKITGNGIIAFIVYATFSNSVVDASWSEHGLGLVLKILLLVVLFVAVTAGLVWWSSRLVGPKLPLRIAAFYCASQKSLATGIPMANAIFAGAVAAGEIDLGMIMLPLLLCHPLQLLLGSYLTGPLARQVAIEAREASPGSVRERQEN